MIEHGVLHDDDRLERLEGEILEMSAIGRAHAACVNRATRLFTSALGPRADLYESRLPGPEDVLLVVEVADTSVEYDRDVKFPLHAKAGIAESWRVSLGDRTIAVYRRPERGKYSEVRSVGPGEAIHPGAFPVLGVQVSALLGG